MLCASSQVAELRGTTLPSSKRQRRYLSYSEIETALSCWARWDFTYGGRLAGSTLKPRRVAAILSEGRAWGAAVAAWHAGYYGRLETGDIHREWGYPILASYDAHAALRRSLEEDAVEAAKLGRPIPVEELADATERLGAMLDHYMGGGR